LLIFATDQLIGLSLEKLYDTSKYQEIAKIRYTIDSTKEDILIFGSSRAQHHYIPDTITKYTGMSAYNCGVGGQGLAFSYIQIHETLKRYKPKLIILDLSPNILFDPLSDQKLKVLLPYYNKDSVIENILTNGSLFEKFKFSFRIYPYNGTAFNIMRAYLHYNQDLYKGYIPLQGIIDTNAIKEARYTHDQLLNFPNKQNAFINRIINECKQNNVGLIFVVSPIYATGKDEKKIIDNIKKLSACHSIEFENFSDDLEFKENRTFFKDSHHLNAKGASYFSEFLSQKLRNIRN